MSESSDHTPDALVDLMLALDPLADLPRAGWVLHGIAAPESLAAHSHGVGIVAMWLVDALRDRGEELDGERVLRMALLHDATEAVTGDIPMPEKTAEASAALEAMERAIAKRLLPSRALADWTEAEHGDSLEARIVRAADKIQMMIKVLAYETKRGARLEEFWENPANFRVAGVAPARAIYEVIAARAKRSLPEPP